MRVLIVEDDVATRKGLDLAIRDLGGQTRAVGTAGEAVRALEEFKPEVLLVDVNLPDGDGIEVFRQAREADPQAKLAALEAEVQARLARGERPKEIAEALALEHGKREVYQLALRLRGAARSE